ncbi:MAG: hypothetical protein LBD64_04260 [Odoribacteraceae bacterium]|jgi:hypothetical protein|nr:hypothetical protein [Odoribacteraceae bacterium]
MKKIFNLVAAAFILLAVACGEKEHTPLLSVTPAELTFGREGGEATFNVASDSKWIISNGKTSWYESDNSAGEKDATVKVTVKASEQAAARKDTIHLTAGITSAFVVVKQQADYEDINTFVTDANLKAALVALFDKDKNGKVSSSEVANAREADLSGKQIANLAGLEYLPALEVLNVSGNALESIDFSKTPFLTSLNCSNNLLTTLNIAQLPELTSLDISGNDWATNRLDISGNTSLTNLNVTDAGIVYIQVWTGFSTSGFTAAPEGELRFRGAAESFISAPAIVNFLQADVNVHSRLEITSNVDWTISGVPSWFTVSVNEGHDNDVATITVTSENATYEERAAVLTIAGDGQTASVTVKQAGIPLPPLEVNKTRVDHAATAGTETISVLSDKQYTIAKPEGEPWYSLSATSGTGNTIVSVTFQANPNKYARLGYIDVIETGSTTGFDGTNVTAVKRLLVRQEGNVTPADEDLLSDYVPDEKFYTALKTFSGITKSGEGGEITVGDARAFTGNLSGSGLYNKQIASFVGVEIFENITQFGPGTTNSNANHNTATVLDLSRNTKITNLTLGRMTELLLVDFSQCTDLAMFTAEYTLLVELDCSNNTKLTRLYCIGGSTVSGDADAGQLRKVNITSCLELAELQLACQKLTELDISNNVKLKGTVSLRRNYFKTLDFSRHPLVTTIHVKDNRLESLIIPTRLNATSDADMTLMIGNDKAVGTDKSFNILSEIDASQCYTIYTINWTGLESLTKVLVPTYPPRERPTINFLPTKDNLPEGVVQEIAPAAVE